MGGLLEDIGVYGWYHDTLPRNTLPRDTLPCDTLPRDTLPRVSTDDLPVNLQQKRGEKCLNSQSTTLYPGTYYPGCSTTMEYPLYEFVSCSTIVCHYNELAFRPRIKR